MRTKLALAALTAALCLAVPAAAGADSIVYVKSNNIWIAKPDGSGAYQVTLDGTASQPYGYPSQADDGTIVASHGSDIVRMRQNGAVLNSFDPPGSTDSAGQPIDGVPQDLSISPDGSKVAYTYYQFGCPAGASCGARTVTRYATADGGNPAFGKLFLRNPSWVNDSRILAFGGFTHQVNIDQADNGTDDDAHWFDDQDVFQNSTDLGDGELSRQGTRLALVRSYGPDVHMAFYAVSGNAQSGPPPATPQVACLSGKVPGLAAPSWSPDGKNLAFQQPDGVEVIGLPNVSAGSCSGATSSQMVLPGASDPDWGPASVNPGPRPGVTIDAPRSVKLATAQRKGVAVDADFPAPGKVDVLAKIGSDVVAKGPISSPDGSDQHITFKLPKNVAAGIKGRTVKLVVSVAFKPSGAGKRSEDSATIRIVG